jgi:hypothetical protein
MSFGESSNRPIYPLTLSHTQQGCLESPFCFVIEKLKSINGPNEQQTSSTHEHKGTHSCSILVPYLNHGG